MKLEHSTPATMETATVGKIKSEPVSSDSSEDEIEPMQDVKPSLGDINATLNTKQMTMNGQEEMEVGHSSSTTVEKLKSEPFSSRNLEHQIKLILDGKPRPLGDRKVTLNAKQITMSELYNQEMWLTACEVEESIYCWMCLLFPIEDNQLLVVTNSVIGSLTSKDLDTRIQQHKKSENHISGFLKFRLFTKQHLVSSVKPTDSATKTRDRAILKRIIDVVCLLIDVTSPPPKAKTGCKVLDVEKCVEILTTMKNYDAYNIADEAIKYMEAKSHSKTPTTIAGGIASFRKMVITKEMQTCSHVSLILSAHSDCIEDSTVSSIFRYVYKGHVCERFVEFKKFASPKNAGVIKAYVMELADEYEIRSKLLSLSCDGGVLRTNSLSTLLDLLPGNPGTFFVPCYLHDFNYTLERNLSNGFAEFNLFFKTLNCLKAFFLDNSKMCEALKNLTSEEIPDLNNFKFTNSQFLRILKMFRRDFIAFFAHIAEVSEKGNKDEVTQATLFQSLLQEHGTVFMIEALCQLFDRVAILSEMFDSCSPEDVFGMTIMDNVKKAVRKEKTEGCDHLCAAVMAELIQDGNREVLDSVSREDTDELCELFLGAADAISEEIEVRYRSYFRLDFLSLLNCEPHNKLVVSDHQVKAIQQMKDSLLDKDMAITEMKVLSLSGALFGGKSVHGLMQLLKTADLSDTFKNVYRLAEIILTLPCKPASHKESKLDIIDAWAPFSNEPEEKLASALCIEKEYLLYLRSRSEFYDAVLSTLQK